MDLQLTVDGRRLKFQPNGGVAAVQNGSETLKGKWRTDAQGNEPEDNSVRYALDSVDQAPLRAEYSFTEDTAQLVMRLRTAEGSASESVTLLGWIEVDDDHHFIYHLIDETGVDTGHNITIYADISFEENTSALVLSLKGGGGPLTLKGDSGVQSIEALENTDAAFNADDLLRYHVTTANTLADNSLLERKAKLDFVGRFDIRDGSLVFASKVKGDLSRPDVALGFAGRLGAVTAGFVYYADRDRTQAAFNIRGRHVWRAGDTVSQFNWESTLGFSDTNKFNARVRFEGERIVQTGRSLTLGGSMTLQDGKGGTLDLDLSLKARYSWENNALSFKADLEEKDGVFSYDLMLEGTFQFSRSTMTFAIRYSNDPGEPGLDVLLKARGDKQSAIQALAFHLHLSEGQVRAQISAEFEVRMRFVKGIGLVLEH